MSDSFDRLAVSRETRDRLRCFAAVFNKWASRLNLVSTRSRDQLVERHIADSLQLVALRPGPARWVDLGSGAGFPGLVTGIVMAEHAEGWVHLIESNQKKAAFLRAAVDASEARCTVHNARIEHVEVEGIDAVSGRALADFDHLLALSKRWLNQPNCVGWYHKGRDYRREVAKARANWSFDLIEHASTIEADSVILEVRNLAGR